MEGTKGCEELEHIFLLMVIGRGAEKAQVLLHAPAMFFLPVATGVYVGHEQGLSLDLRPDSTTHGVPLSRSLNQVELSSLSSKCRS